MIDVSKIRIGDEGTIRVRIIEKNVSGNFKVEVLKYGCCTWVFPSDIVTHTPKPREFKPGDRVTWDRGHVIFELIAIRKDNAAVWKEGYGWYIKSVSDLRHAEESE